MDFGVIEAAMVDALRAGVTYLKEVRSNASGDQAGAALKAMRYPSAQVVYAGSAYERVDGPVYEERARFRVMLFGRSARGQEALRTSDTGMYGLIGDTLKALTNNDLGLAIERLRPVRTWIESADGLTVVYGMEFETGFDRTYS